jgi:hypothetical protein
MEIQFLRAVGAFGLRPPDKHTEREAMKPTLEKQANPVLTSYDFDYPIHYSRRAGITIKTIAMGLAPVIDEDTVYVSRCSQFSSSSVASVAPPCPRKVPIL